MKMDTKTALVLTIVSMCALEVKAAVDEKVLLENIQECKKKNNLDDKDLEAAMKMNYTDENKKCFASCIGEKIGYIQDGEFSERGALNAVDVMMSDAEETDKLKAQQMVTTCARKLKDQKPQGCEIGPAAAFCLGKGAVDTGIISKEKLKEMQKN